MVVFQVVSVCIWKDENQLGDYNHYIRLARGLASNNSFYPSTEHIYDFYIANPGYVNYLGLLFRFSDSIILALFMNIVLTIILAGSVFVICEALFANRNISCISVIIMYLFLATSAGVLFASTEMLFIPLSFAGVAIAIANSWSPRKIAISGVLLALANWTRPFAAMYIVAILFYFIFKKVKKMCYLTFFSAFALTLIVIGTIAYFRSGVFVPGATTTGSNLMMVCNDESDGTADSFIFQEGQIGYLSEEQLANMTFTEVNKHYTDLSLEWLKKNPGKFIAQTPYKLFALYAYDTWNMFAYSGFEVKTMAEEYLRSLLSKLFQLRLSELTLLDLSVIINQFQYMIIMLLAIIGIVFIIRRRQNVIDALTLIIIILAGTGICVISVSAARYHEPFMPCMYIFAAIAVNELLGRYIVKAPRCENGYPA